MRWILSKYTNLTRAEGNRFGNFERTHVRRMMVCVRRRHLCPEAYWREWRLVGGDILSAFGSDITVQREKDEMIILSTKKSSKLIEASDWMRTMKTTSVNRRERQDNDDTARRQCKG